MILLEISLINHFFLTLHNSTDFDSHIYVQYILNKMCLNDDQNLQDVNFLWQQIVRTEIIILYIDTS